MAEILTHNNWLDFWKAIVAEKSNIEKFYRMDLAAILEGSRELVSSEAPIILVLERDEASIVGSDNSHLETNHLTAFHILKTCDKGVQAYSEHDEIFQETDTIAWEVIKLIKQRWLDTVDGTTNHGIYEFNVAGTKAFKVGPVLGARYGVRYQIQIKTAARAIE